MKKILISTILVIVLVISLNSVANAKVEIDKNICQETTKKTGLKILNFTELSELSKLDNIKLSVWVKGRGGLNDEKFSSEEKKNDIKNTLTLNFDLRYQDGLFCSLRIAKFKNYKDSKLAWLDASPSFPQPNHGYRTKLFSDESIPNCEIKIFAPECECYSNAYIFYKNWLSEISFVTGERLIQKNSVNPSAFINEIDHKKMDEIIKKIIKTIDEIEFN